MEARIRFEYRCNAWHAFVLWAGFICLWIGPREAFLALAVVSLGLSVAMAWAPWRALGWHAFIAAALVCIFQGALWSWAQWHGSVYILPSDVELVAQALTAHFLAASFVNVVASIGHLQFVAERTNEQGDAV